MSLIAAYMTFYISEAVLGISGVLAVVALGVVMNSQRTVISPEVEPVMHEYVSKLSFLPFLIYNCCFKTGSGRC